MDLHAAAPPRVSCPNRPLVPLAPRAIAQDVIRLVENAYDFAHVIDEVGDLGSEKPRRLECSS
jgi:hypothetical protein